MLINTVLVFLQNILPIFVVISLLFALRTFNQKTVNVQENKTLPRLSLAHALQAAATGMIVVSLLSYHMATISQWFSNRGLEVVFSLLFSLIYLAIVMLFLTNFSFNKKQWQQNMLSYTVFLLVFCVHGSYFSLYVMSLVIQSSAFNTLFFGLVIGVIIGTGICLSIAILLYFILRTLNKKTTTKVAGYFLLFFGVGQLMQAMQLLEQVDIISSGAQLWSTGHLIAEASEFGYFFTILVGYEATPSAMQLALYLSALIIPVLVAQLIAYKQNPQYLSKKGTY